MTVLMTLDLPVSREDLEALSAAAGSVENPPEGLIVHTATETAGGVRVVDVWESQAQFEKFRDDRLMASLQKVAAERGLEVSGPPEPTFEEVFDVVQGR
jgi:hypothetical protein